MSTSLTARTIRAELADIVGDDNVCRGQRRVSTKRMPRRHVASAVYRTPSCCLGRLSRSRRPSRGHTAGRSHSCLAVAERDWRAAPCRSEEEWSSRSSVSLACHRFLARAAPDDGRRRHHHGDGQAPRAGERPFVPPGPRGGRAISDRGQHGDQRRGSSRFQVWGDGRLGHGYRRRRPPGDHVRIGGGQRKDVGGYDIKNLLVGSEGTLGVITAVTVQLLPAREVVTPVVLFFDAAEAAITAVLDVVASGLQPATLDYLDGTTLSIVRAAYPGDVPDQAAFVLISEFDGTRQEVQHAQDDLRELVGGRVLAFHTPTPNAVWRWRDGVSGAVTTLRGAKVSEDIVVPPERLGDAVEAIAGIGRDLGLETCSWGHAGDGNMHASFLVDPSDAESLAIATRGTDRLFEMAVELGGSITGEHGIGYVKRGQLARQWDERALALHEQIKATFDPLGILNPGKKVARLPS